MTPTRRRHPPLIKTNVKETPLACGSCDTSGRKIIPKGDARLESGGHHHFVIAFDAFDLDGSVVDEGASSGSSLS